MGWDAFAQHKHLHLPAFENISTNVRRKCGGVDGGLGEGWLDCSACAHALEQATGVSPWGENWPAQRVLFLHQIADWSKATGECWAVESARAFLFICALKELEIHFSW